MNAPDMVVLSRKAERGRDDAGNDAQRNKDERADNQRRGDAHDCSEQRI
jgi:hypothetical protein